MRQGIALGNEPFTFLTKSHQELGDAFTITPPGTMPMVFLNDPAAVKEVFSISNVDIDQSQIPFPLDIGEKNTGFLNGTEHKDARKILIPNLNTQRLKDRAVVMQEIINDRVNQLENGQQIDMTRFVGDVTLDIACYTLTGYQSGPVKDRYKYLMEKWLRLATGNSMFALGILFGTARWRYFMNSLYKKKLAAGDSGKERAFYFTPWGRPVALKVQLDHMLRNDIRKARKNPDDNNHSILYYLSAAIDSQGEQLSEERVIAESLAMLFGGHETSAGTGGFLSLWLLKNPKVYEKIREEVNASIKKEGGFNGLAISQLSYLNAAFNESQRLTPIAYGIIRCLKRDMRIAGYDLPAGIGLFVSPYLIGRHKEVWGDDANSFRPERWLENKGVKPYEFFPFGGGQRTCVGMNQARQQLKILFAMLLIKTDWESKYKNNDLWPGHQNIAGSTHPKGGVPITIRKR
ncbi:MAG: cytochrome P450 [Pseudomonadales bacterium]|nr:cytochrome P450 [Pseudomonadales bacterium]